MEEIDVIRTLFAAFAGRDVDGSIEFVTADVEIWPKVGMAHFGRDEPYRGHEGIRAYFADLEATFDQLEIEAQSIRDVAGGAVVFGTVRGRPLGADAFEVPVVLMVRLVEQRVAHIRSVANLDGAEGQPGPA